MVLFSVYVALCSSGVYNPVMVVFIHLMVGIGLCRTSDSFKGVWVGKSAALASISLKRGCVYVELADHIFSSLFLPALFFFLLVTFVHCSFF